MIVIGFDLPKHCIRIMRDDTAGKEEAISRLSYRERAFTDEFYAEVAGLLHGFFDGYYKDKSKGRTRSACLVLPNEAVGFETFTIPNMSRLKMQQAFETELSNLYEDRQKDKKLNRVVLTKSKQNTVYGVFSFDKRVVSEMYKIMVECRVLPRHTTYSGNALLDGVFESSFRSRGKSFLFADVRRDETMIVVSAKGKTLGVARVPHGYSVLNPHELESEYMRTDHEAGELAVINAREIARSRSLTMSGEDTAEEGGEGAAEETAAENTEESTAEIAEEGSETEDDAENDRMDNRPKKIKVFRKIPKRYPKFMTREFPQTEEGYLFENFRILAKWMLLYARQAALTEYIPSPEFILVNLPERYRFLLEKMNDEAGESGLQFRAFTGADKLPEEMRENFDLVGGRYAKQFNRNENF